MPLSQSKSQPAFTKNLKTELDAGKPKKQALAIAYAIQRRNLSKGGPVVAIMKPRNYARGGFVAGGRMRPKPQHGPYVTSMIHQPGMTPFDGPRASAPHVIQHNGPVPSRYARGGAVGYPREGYLKGDKRGLPSSYGRPTYAKGGGIGLPEEPEEHFYPEDAEELDKQTGRMHEPEEFESHDGEAAALHRAIGGMVEKIIRKRTDPHDDPTKLSQGGLDDDAPPAYESYQSSSSHMAKGGETCPHCGNKYAHGGKVGEVFPEGSGDSGDVGSQADEDQEFLEHGARVVPDPDTDYDMGTEPQSEDEDEEQEKGKVDLRHIMASLRKKHMSGKRM